MTYCPEVAPAPYIRMGVEGFGGGVDGGKLSGMGKESWSKRI
jgi:hypothetical protein